MNRRKRLENMFGKEEIVLEKEFHKLKILRIHKLRVEQQYTHL